MNTKEKIAVMQAFVDGKKIECLYKRYWVRTDKPCWDWLSFDYRIKPEPREWWIHFDAVGNVYEAYTKDPKLGLGGEAVIVKVREVLE